MLGIGIGILLGLTLTVEPVKPEVTLGEPIELKVTAKGTGEGPAVVLDKRAVTLSIGDGAKQFVYQRTLDDAPHNVALSGGASGTVSFTPVRAGEVPIEVNYWGKESAKIKVKVKPAADGSTELGMLLLTGKGEMKLRFFPEVAPNHVAHFAERVRTGFYNGLTLHRVIKNFMAQGGDPQGTGGGGPGYSIPQEFTNDKKYSHTFGRLSTARTNDPDSGGSQFFLCFDQATFLDGKYTVLGEVFEGQPALRAIEAIGAERDPQKPKEIVKIERAALIPLKNAGS